MPCNTILFLAFIVHFIYLSSIGAAASRPPSRSSGGADDDAAAAANDDDAALCFVCIAVQHRRPLVSCVVLLCWGWGGVWL
jgi:hypothetical protein